jgi:hypothetical protein
MKKGLFVWGMGLTFGLFGQNGSLSNSGISSGSINHNSKAPQAVVGTIGNPVGIQVLRGNGQVVHHGLDHPLVMKTSSVDLSVHVYPNPTSGSVQIKTNGWDSVEGATLSVLDASGRILQVQPYSPNLDLSPYPSGTYTVKIQQHNQELTSQPIILTR